MPVEIKSSSAGFHIDTTSFPGQDTRLKTLRKQAGDDRHPADAVVVGQILDCGQCPGKAQAIGELLEARDRLEIKTAGSWDQSGLHRLDAKIALCSSCGVNEKPRVLLKSA
jgi:hypothetical protein